MHQASVGFHCPECAKTGRQQEFRGIASLQVQPRATQVLIAVNLAIFVLGIVFSGTGAATGRARSLTLDGGLFGPNVPEEPWRLFTSGFLHAGFIHVGLNMWVLWVLGRFLEPSLGRVRFLALYGAALCGGALGVVLLSPGALTVGASGAIYGLMGGALLVARERRIDLMASGLLPTLGINLLLTFGIPGISIGGHLGGLVAGALAGLVLTEVSKRLGKKGDLVATGLTAAFGVVLAAVAYLLMFAQYG